MRRIAAAAIALFLSLGTFADRTVSLKDGSARFWPSHFALSRDGKYAAIGNNHRGIKLFSAETGNLLDSFMFQDSGYGERYLHFSDDGLLAVFNNPESGNNVVIRNMLSGTSKTVMDSSSISGAEFSSDGKYCALLIEGRGRKYFAALIDCASGDELFRIERGERFFVSFERDGSRFFAVTPRTVKADGGSRRVYRFDRYDAASGESLGGFDSSPFSGSPRTFIKTFSEKTCIAVLDDNSINVIGTVSGDSVLKKELNGLGGLDYFEFSEDSALLLDYTRDGSDNVDAVRVWDLAGGKKIFEAALSAEKWSGVSFAGGGSGIVLVNSEKLKFVDIAKADSSAEIPQDKARALYSLLENLDGQKSLFSEEITVENLKGLLSERFINAGTNGTGRRFSSLRHGARKKRPSAYAIIFRSRAESTRTISIMRSICSLTWRRTLLKH